jgi:uncharacterized protein YndB with AHSA1/START domain
MSEATSVTVRRTLPAAAAEVFASWTSAEEAHHWLASGGRVLLDARVDGLFFIEMIYKGRGYPHYGRYLRVEAARLLEFTWMSEGTRGKETVVRVELTARGGETDLVLTHSGFATAEEAAPHEGGWAELLEDLAKRLA